MLLRQNRPLSRDEMHTFLVEAAGIVNHTPLYGVSTDPNDPAPITPSMLLTLRDDPSPRPPEEFSSSDALAFGPRRWRRAQFLADDFWTKWRRDYVQELQSRHK